MALPMEHYVQIREAQIKGARTLEELQNHIDFEIDSKNQKDVEAVLISACKCMGKTIEEIVFIVKSGADTLDKVQLISNAGMVCGRCNTLLESIIKRRK